RSLNSQPAGALKRRTKQKESGTMKPTKCLTYVLCLAAVLVTTAGGQLSANTTRQPVARAELRRALDSFAEWTGRNANRVDWPQNIQEEGLKIAKQRRAALTQLIETDPAQALSNAVSARVRGSLPPVIQGELENSVSGFGDLLVLCAMPSAEFPASGGIQRVVRLDGRTYRAMVYGRGLEQSTTFHIPLHGIELDGVLALDSDVFSPLTAPKVASRPFVVPVTGQIQSKALVIRVDFSDMPGDPRRS